MTKHRLNELEAQNARLEARIIAMETALAAWLPETPSECLPRNESTRRADREASRLIDLMERTP